MARAAGPQIAAARLERESGRCPSGRRWRPYRECSTDRANRNHAFRGGTRMIEEQLGLAGVVALVVGGVLLLIHALSRPLGDLPILTRYTIGVGALLGGLALWAWLVGWHTALPAWELPVVAAAIAAGAGLGTRIGHWHDGLSDTV